MPSHSHAASTNNTGAHTHGLPQNSGWDGSPRFSGASEAAQRTVQTDSAGNHSHTVTINNSGGGQAHNNMPPYLSVYMWQRTA